MILLKNAVLVFTKTKNDFYDINYKIEELENLCQTCEINTVDYIVQSLERPNKEFFIGSGKIKELKELINTKDADIVVFDDELSPSTLKNVEDFLEIEVIDRSYVILEIFKTRAKTKESILEVEIARARYLFPRLSAMQSGMSREGGSSSLHSKGKGETKLELDRRTLLSTIIRAERELEKIKQNKIIQAKKRKENKIPIVALVGYTNAGKSTTMNKIIEYTSNDSDKMVYAKDELFATLDTSTRKISYKKHDFLLVDTIGFVSNLPHHLINSFRSTLEEIKSADLIIHVVDISSRYYAEQYDTVCEVLDMLGCSNIKSLLLLNKYDKYDDDNTYIAGIDNIAYSNYQNKGVTELLDYIYENTIPYMIDLELNIDYKYGKIINLIEEKATIISKVYLQNNVYYHISIDKRYYKDLEMFENKELN